MATILIADDDQGILDSTKLLLEYEGYTVLTAADGDAVKKASKKRPDVILLDIWLSGTHGADLAKYLLSHKQTKDIPIIMFSANKDIEMIAKDANVHDFLIKPFDINDMIKKIEKYLQTSTNS